MERKEGKRKRKSLTKIINYQGMFVRVSFSRLMDYFWFCLFQYIRLTLPIRVIHTLTVLLFNHWNIQTIDSAVVIFDRFVSQFVYDIVKLRNFGPKRCQTSNNSRKKYHMSFDLIQFIGNFTFTHTKFTFDTNKIF